MVSLIEIENKLNIVVGDREINPGMCQPLKNRYYNINNDFLVVEFLHDTHMVFSVQKSNLAYWFKWVRKQ